MLPRARACAGFGLGLLLACLSASCNNNMAAGPPDLADTRVCYGANPAYCQTATTLDCVDLDSDNKHCGECNAPCAPPSSCTKGVCKIFCGTLLLCEKEGRCVDSQTDPKHCGNCDTVCNGGMCLRGKCVAVCTAPLDLCGDTCVNKTSDRLNCGACNNACPAGQACVDSNCTFDCPVSLTNCNGVCVALYRDPAHCGGCGKACAQGQVCSNGRCTDTCKQGTLPCPGGCANLTTDPRNCGACDKVCPKSTVCSLGVCDTKGCAAGLDPNCVPGGCVNLATDAGHCGTCDNACPSDQACSLRRCSATCDHGLTLCGGACVNLQTDPRNCGACNTACNFTKVCSLGRCVDQCDNGLDGVCIPGGCVNRSTDSGHCGTCDNSCANDQICSNGKCAMACDPGLKQCSGVCSDINTDIGHCGNCAVTCPTQQYCAQGMCVVKCPSPQSPCGGTCRDLTADPANCGTCGTTCGAVPHGTPSCSASRCLATCELGFADCDKSFANGCEVALAADPMNCGACGKRCNVANGVGKCEKSMCSIDVCAAGFDDCNKDPNDGCEANLNTNSNHCKMCGMACPTYPFSTPWCNAGMCDVTCNGGRGNCDLMPMNGCEVNVLTDPDNCGACGNKCPMARPSCVNGFCSP